MAINLWRTEIMKSWKAMYEKIFYPLIFLFKRINKSFLEIIYSLLLIDSNNYVVFYFFLMQSQSLKIFK